MRIGMVNKFQGFTKIFKIATLWKIWITVNGKICQKVQSGVQ